MNLKVCRILPVFCTYNSISTVLSIVQAAKFMHRYRSGRIYRYRSWYRQMLLGGSMQRAARAMHCIALSQIQCPQWECLRSTQRVEIGPQWELSVYLLRIPR